MNVAIIGTGAYGLALSLMFHKNKCNIKMWTKFEKEKKEIEENRENKRALGGVSIPEDINITIDMEDAIKDARLIVIAVPAAFVNDVSLLIAPLIKKKEQHILIASKGIEQGSCLFVSDIIKRHIKTKRIAVISGPSFAIDIANNDPIGLSLATKCKETEKVVMKALKNDTMKLRSTRDVIGVEICGSIKNVIAIAAGMLKGMKYSESTQAMFITESLHDIRELIKVLGGSRKTILSFAGFGDLLLTATSDKSRNYKFGCLIGKGATREEIDEYINDTTIEGLYTLKSIYKLLKNKKAKIPIINIIYDIVFKEKSPTELREFLILK